MQIVDHAIARFVLKSNLTWAEIHLLLDWILPDHLNSYIGDTYYPDCKYGFCYHCKRSLYDDVGVLINCNGCASILNAKPKHEKDKHRLMYNYAMNLFLHRPPESQQGIMRLLYEKSL